jgi:hypothetical protein
VLSASLGGALDKSFEELLASTTSILLGPLAGTQRESDEPALDNTTVMNEKETIDGVREDADKVDSKPMTSRCDRRCGDGVC